MVVSSAAALNVGMTTFKSCGVGFAGALLGAFFVNTVAFAQTKPAVNLTTPTEAMITFGRASSAGDWATVETAVIGTDEQRVQTKQMLRGFRGHINRMSAYDAHFGGNTADTMGFTAANEKMLREMPVKIEGDAASITVRDPEARKEVPAMKVDFKKIDGDWKLDLGSYLQYSQTTREADAAHTDRILTIIERASEEIIAGLDAGAYASREEAERAFGQLFAERFATATTQPTKMTE